MKKILVVLLVLAVAGGVFAQEGDWSFDGDAQIGFAVNIDPVPDADEPALVTSSGSQYNRLYDGYDNLRGKFGINYSRDGFGAGVTIRTVNPGASTFIGSLNYGGEGFNFAVESDLSALTAWSSSDFKQLWGNYEFLNGLVFLEASYVSGWKGEQFWASDLTGAFRNWSGRGNDGPLFGFGIGKHTFTMIDGDWEGGPSSYIVTDVRLEGLRFGVMIRDIFLRDKEYMDLRYLGLPVTMSVPVTFVDDVLKNMIFGVKFEQNPVEVAAQFLVRDYSVYLGGKFFAGPITAGLSFMGILGEKYLDNMEGYWVAEDVLDDDDNLIGYDIVGYPTKKTYKAAETTKMKVGGGINYDAEGFGAVLKAAFAIDGQKDTGKVNEFGFEPGFYYNVIPSHLQFKLDAGFYFFSIYDKDGEKQTDGYNTVQYALQPQLFWNFLGTGAGGYGGTGIAIRYRVIGGDPQKVSFIDLNNKFDVNFRFSF
jgi:hypothetical protein